MKTSQLCSFTAVSFAGISAAVATGDYGPAVDRIITGCAKYYTSGSGHQFCAVHDMEGYYLSGISYLSRCDVSASCHYCLNGQTDYAGDAPPGEISQLVPEAYYSWHASCWNRHSVGCEHEGFASNPAWFTEAMYQSSALLYRHFCDKFGIPIDRNHIVGHYQWQDGNWVSWVINNLGFDPRCNTHTDPGPYWDWNHYMDLINGQPAAINPPYWFTSGTDGWTVGNSLGALGYNNTDWPGIIYADQTGNDAFFYGPASSYTGGAEASVNVSVFPQGGTTASHNMQMFFISASDTTWSADKSSPAVSYTAQNTYARINLDVNASWPKYYNQTITQLRLDVDNNNSSTRWIIDHVIAQSTPRWRFDADTSGWTPANGLTALAWTGTGWPGIIYTDQVGDDPQLVSPFMFYYGGINDTVHVRVYPQNGATANHTMELFFSSASDGTFSEANSMTVNYTAKDTWADVYFNVGQRANWSSDAIHWVRLDPDQINQGNRWIIDSVQIEHATAAVGTPAPTIGAQPQTQSANQGASVTFTVFPNGTAPFSYQWRKNGGNVTGATSSVYTLSNVQLADAGSYTVFIGNAGGSVTSAQAQLTVNAVPPSITTQPANQTATAGYTATFSVTAAGTAPLSYQWRKNGSGLAGATTSVLTVNNAQTANQGSYSVVVTNAHGTVTSSDATLTVLNTSPAITTQPQGQGVVAGANVTFSVAATGAIPLSYQWRRNGADISGATLSAYTRNNVQPADAGSYSVMVTNQFGSLPSSSAVLTVATLPQITAQPQAQNLSAGANATFTVTATGAATLAYQWRRNGVSVAGATNSTYTRSNVQSGDVGLYCVVVSNPYGSITSVEVTLSLNAVIVFSDNFESGNLDNWTFAPSPATTLTASTAQNHTSGGADSAYADNSLDKMYRNLGLELEGHARLIFWAYNDTPSTANSGQTRWYGEMRGYSGAGYGDGTLQQLFAIGRYGIALGAGTGTLAGQTVNTANYQGRVVSGPNTGWFNLSVQRSVGWHKFEIDRAADGATINFYVDNALGGSVPAAAFATWDSVAIGSGSGSGSGTVGDAWFDDVTVQYYDPPTITVQPAGQTVTAGAGATFSVTAANNAQTYQWRLNGVNLADSGNISGVASPTLTLGNAQGSDAGSYTVVVANGAGPVVSAAANLQVSPAITTAPASVTRVAGTTATFTVVAAGQTPISYQWKKNGGNLTDGGNVSGANTATLTLLGVSQGDAGSYNVVASNAAGNAASTSATLTVLDPPTITTQPQGQAVAAGAAVTFSVAATGSSPLAYQWSLGGVPISGATASSLTKTGVQSADAGSYTVALTNAAGWAVSGAAVLSVNNPPILASIPNRRIHAGSTVVVSSSVTHPDLDQTLTFTLDPGAPVGATLDAAMGVFRWTAPDASAGTTNSVTVRVADDGAPSLSDAKSFTIAVVVRPRVISATVSRDTLTLTWSAIPGQIYHVQSADDLGASAWADLTDVTADGPTASCLDGIVGEAGPIPQRFYRILVAN